MINPPITLEEAKRVKYGTQSNRAYDEGHCSYEVWGSIWQAYQCHYKNGKGVAGLYCGIHAKKVPS